MRWLTVLLLLSMAASEAAQAMQNFARPPEVRESLEKPSRRRLERPERPRPAREEAKPVREESSPPQEAPKPEQAEPRAEEQPRLEGPAVDSLSAYFGVDLTNADYATTITALADRLNRQTLIGVRPEQELDRFRRVSKGWGRGGRQSMRTIDRLYRNMVDYLAIEAEFQRKPTAKTLRRAEELVEAQIELDPNVPDERGKQIVEIMEANGQFPPASIVFGVPLRPYREYKPPAGHTVLGVPLEPEYVDEEQRARATFDFLTCPGPICRIDFEAARVGELTVEQSTNGRTYNGVNVWKSVAPGGLQGPVILPKPVRARCVRVTGAGASEPPMLRNVQVAALKGPCAAIVASAASPPTLDASFKEPSWPRQAEVIGFVSEDATRFASQQSEIRLCAAADTLYIAIYARDNRMKTAVSKQTERDAPLEGDESFEVRIRPSRAEALRFAVNLTGTQFDARDGDASWDGEWQAVTKSYPTGWAAEIAIPFATLGVRPRSGETLYANFIRHRRNVENEDSAWAAGRTEFGTLAF